MIDNPDEIRGGAMNGSNSSSVDPALGLGVAMFEQVVHHTTRNSEAMNMPIVDTGCKVFEEMF